MKGQQRKKLLYGILPVVLFSFAIAYISWYKIFEYPPHRYSLDFNGATWISTGGKTPHGYFVKEIFIPDEVADSWITIAATDSVLLYVNGIRIASDTFVSLNVSGIHDITGKIQQGRNVIAVYAHRSSYPGEPRLLLKGVYTDLTRQEHFFVTNNTWQVSSVREIQGQGNILWYSTQFDYSGWNRAKIEGTATTFPVYTSKIPPYILGKPLSGYWIWHPEPGIRSAYFIKSFILKSPVKDAFIGIAGTTVYDLTINGIVVGRNRIGVKKLDIYNITPLLHSGKNIVGVGVKSLETSPGLFINGYIQDSNSIINLKSNAAWKTISSIAAEIDMPDPSSSKWMVPVLLAEYPSQPWDVLPKRIKHLDLPSSYTVQRDLKFISFALIVTAVMLSLWLVIAFLFAKIKNDNFHDRLLVDGFLHILPLLFISSIYLLKFDVRYNTSFPFQFKYVFFSLIILFSLRMAELIVIKDKEL